MANNGFSGSPDDFETIARSTVPSELAVMKALLESERIPAFIVDGGIHQLHFLIAVATGGARLQVPVEYAAVARRILADLAAGELVLDEDDQALYDDAQEKSSASEDKRRGRALGAALLFFLGGS